MTVIQAGNLKNLKSTANKNQVIDIFNETGMQITL